MSHQDLQDSTLALFRKRRRVHIACRHCRRRKIKCVITEESPDKPCERCAKRGLRCEYISVANQQTHPPSPTSAQSGREEPTTNLAQSKPPTHYRPNTWSQSARAYDGINPGGAQPSAFPRNTRSNLPYSNSPLPMPVTQTDPYRSSRPQHDAAPQYPTYNYPAMTAAGPSHAPPVMPYPTSGLPQHQRPPVHGYYDQYRQHFPNPSPNHNNNNMFYPTTMYNFNRQASLRSGSGIFGSLQWRGGGIYYTRVVHSAVSCTEQKRVRIRYNFIERHSPKSDPKIPTGLDDDSWMSHACGADVARFRRFSTEGVGGHPIFVLESMDHSETFWQLRVSFLALKTFTNFYTHLPVEALFLGIIPHYQPEFESTLIQGQSIHIEEAVYATPSAQDTSPLAVLPIFVGFRAPFQREHLNPNADESSQKCGWPNECGASIHRASIRGGRVCMHRGNLYVYWQMAGSTGFGTGEADGITDGEGVFTWSRLEAGGSWMRQLQRHPRTSRQSWDSIGAWAAMIGMCGSLSETDGVVAFMRVKKGVKHVLPGDAQPQEAGITKDKCRKATIAAKSPLAAENREIQFCKHRHNKLPREGHFEQLDVVKPRKMRHRRSRDSETPRIPQPEPFGGEWYTRQNLEHARGRGK
ncbi:hypothetical protein C8R44DRAFT_736140 [Mycena epipterygia]|nr:hypothetical protein C8R44DRAFT_736140 [Mycena epipterygia]